MARAKRHNVVGMYADYRRPLTLTKEDAAFMNKLTLAVNKRKDAAKQGQSGTMHFPIRALVRLEILAGFDPAAVKRSWKLMRAEFTHRYPVNHEIMIVRINQVRKRIRYNKQKQAKETKPDA